jgi:hypothetical protein
MKRVCRKEYGGHRCATDGKSIVAWHQLANATLELGMKIKRRNEGGKLNCKQAIAPLWEMMIHIAVQWRLLPRIDWQIRMWLR